MKNILKVATTAQALLFNLELRGQISDGFWENSKPHNHYKEPCKAEVVIDSAVQGINFPLSRRYNFANPELIEYVGERMRMYVLLARKFPSLSQTSLRHCDSGDWIWQTKVGEEHPEWQLQFHREMSEVCGVHSYKELQAVLAGLDYSQYSIKDLRKDLKAINEAFKTRILIPEKA